MSQQINLFNPVFLKQKKVFSSIAMARALGVLAFGALAMVAYGRQQVAALEKEAKAASAQLEQKQARQAMVNSEFAPREPGQELQAEIVQAEARLRALRSVSGVLARGGLGDTNGYAEYFKALARQNIDGLWLTGVSVAGADVGIRGRALDSKLVPGYITRLTREPVMQGKSFGSLQITEGQLKGPDGKPASAPFVEFRLESVVPEGAK
ncbi:MAG: PilN domain-containing protein [Telluria sp.]